jgi:drug/metabolite transporter (DMT)-like permease
MKNININWVFLIVLGIIWGASFMGAKVALTGFGPMTVAALRLAIGASVLLSISYAMGKGLPKLSDENGKRIWMHCIGMGIFTNALPFTMLNWGQLHVTSGFAGISMAVVPLLVLPLAHVLVPGEILTKRKALGFFVGFLGTLILIGPKTLLASTGGDLEPIARLACILAACCYAVGSIITRLCPKVSLTSYASAGLTIGTLIMVPVALYFEGIPTMPSETKAIWGVLFLGVLPTALATLLLVRVINSAGPSFMSLVNYQVPVWAVIFGVVILGEDIPASLFAALALILLGLAISQKRRKKV